MVCQSLEVFFGTPVAPALVAAYLIFFMSSCGTLSWTEDRLGQGAKRLVFRLNVLFFFPFFCFLFFFFPQYTKKKEDKTTVYACCHAYTYVFGNKCIPKKLVHSKIYSLLKNRENPEKNEEF